MFTNSTASYEEIRAQTLQANEIPALFESIAEISGVDEADEDESSEAYAQDGTAVNAYGSPLSLWELKSGLLTIDAPTSRSLWSRLKWGVCQKAIEDMGGEGRRPEGVAVSDANPHLSSRIDMEVSTDLGTTWEPMIAKNVAGISVGMWRNVVGDWVVPEAVMLEAQHHMLVRGCARVHVVAFFSGTTVHTFVVERDEDLVAEIADAAARFWDCVEQKRRPKPSTKADQKVLARLNAIIDPKEDILDLRGDGEFQQMIAEKDRIKAEEKQLKSRIDEIDAAMREKLDGFASARISDTHQMRWIKTPAKTVSYTTKPSAYLRSTKINKAAAGSGMDDLIESDS